VFADGRNGEFALFVTAGGSFGVQFHRAEQITASLVSRSLLTSTSAAWTLAGKIQSIAVSAVKFAKYECLQ
jgi:hypothetical protein